MELGGSWCYRGLWLVPDGTSLTSQPHVNPPNLGSQTLRLQRGAAPFTFLFLPICSLEDHQLFKDSKMRSNFNRNRQFHPLFVLSWPNRLQHQLDEEILAWGFSPKRFSLLTRKDASNLGQKITNQDGFLPQFHGRMINCHYQISFFLLQSTGWC